MTEYFLGSVIMILLLVAFDRWRDEHRTRQHRKRREDFIHLVGKKPWWGER